MVDKDIIVENKIKEMEKNGKRKQHSQDGPREATPGLASLSQGLSSET
jgi:hypothetical protein